MTHKGHTCVLRSELQSAIYYRTSAFPFTDGTSFYWSQSALSQMFHYQDKGKNTIFAFMEFLYQEKFRLEKKHSEKEIMWNDGASSKLNNSFS